MKKPNKSALRKSLLSLSLSLVMLCASGAMVLAAQPPDETAGSSAPTSSAVSFAQSGSELSSSAVGEEPGSGESGSLPVQPEEKADSAPSEKPAAGQPAAGITPYANGSVVDEDSLRARVDELLQAGSRGSISLDADITLTQPLELNLPNPGPATASMTIISNGHSLKTTGDFYQIEHTSGYLSIIGVVFDGGLGVRSQGSSSSGTSGNRFVAKDGTRFVNGAGLSVQGGYSHELWYVAFEGAGVNRRAITLDGVPSMSLTECEISGYGGGAIYAYNSKLYTTYLDAHDNTATYGGAVHFVADDAANMLSISAGDLHDNAADYGGGIYVEGAETKVSIQAHFTTNTAHYDGGAAYFADGTAPAGITWRLYTTRNNTAGRHGGAIYLGECGTLTITAANFTGNSAQEGGVIYTAGTDIVAQGNGSRQATFEDNWAIDHGGAVALKGATTLQANDVLFARNGAWNGHGGAILVDSSASGALQVTDTNFHGNFAWSDGGAVAIRQNTGGNTITGGEFADNEAYLGGAVYNAHGGLQVRDTEFTDNWAEWNGGVFYTWGPLSVADGTFTGNSSDGDGGVFYLSGANDSSLTVQDSTFTGNFAYASGGVVFADATPLVRITGGLLSGNAANFWRGGALFGQDTHFELDSVELIDNTARDAGGAIYLDNATATLAGTVLQRNKTLATTQENGVLGSGGAAYLSATSTMTLSGAGKVLDNSSHFSGGGFYLEDGARLLLKDTVQLTGNSAGVSGGAVHVPWSGIAGVSAESGVSFSQNTVPTGYEATDPAHITLHGQYILATTFSAGYTNAYNNCDITYLGGDPVVTLYTLTFNANGGAPQPDPASLELAAGAPAPEPEEPKREGHSFLGWYDEDEVRWIFEDDDDLGLVASTMPADNVLLTAEYEINTYKLTFDYGWGGYKDEYPKEFGESYARPDDPSRAGYTFTGWYLAGTLWTADTGTMPARNVTYTAGWRALTTPPTSSSSSQGGGDNASSSTPPPVPGSSSTPQQSSSSSPSSSGSSSPQSSSSTPSSETPALSSSSEGPPTVRTLDDNGGRGNPGDADYIQPNGSLRLFGAEIPLGGLASVGGWSLFNLVMALIALIASLQLALRTLLRRARGGRDSGGDTDLLDNVGQSAAALGAWHWAYIAVGAVPAVLLPILENFGYEMMLFSRWTPLFICLVLAHGALGLVAGLRSRGRHGA